MTLMNIEQGILNVSLWETFTDFKDYKIYIKDLIDFSGVAKGRIVY